MKPKTKKPGSRKASADCVAAQPCRRKRVVKQLEPAQPSVAAKHGSDITQTPVLKSRTGYSVLASRRHFRKRDPMHIAEVADSIHSVPSYQPIPAGIAGVVIDAPVRLQAFREMMAESDCTPPKPRRTKKRGTV